MTGIRTKGSLLNLNLLEDSNQDKQDKMTWRYLDGDGVKGRDEARSTPRGADLS